MMTIYKGFMAYLFYREWFVLALDHVDRSAGRFGPGTAYR
jgi:hypothetical protein